MAVDAMRTGPVDPMETCMSFSPRLAGGAALIAAALAASACTPVRSHQGYVVDKELVDAIQPGIDTRTSVLETLGRPTLTSQFDENTWYYVAREARNLAYQDPKVRSQLTLRVRFDAAGNVASVDRMGADLVASIDPYGKTTPTLGHKRGFFEDLFGNIGTVGAPGGGAGPGSNTGGQ
jgi:outer membrane protein assembly factor BamE (lipoprotein component of BamABCDE complex)